MKKILLFLLLLFVLPASYSQLLLKVNDKLIYDVDVNGLQYNFAVKIKQLKPGFNFVWQMNNEDAVYGSVKVLLSPMLTSYKMSNYFKPGNMVLNSTTTVQISKAAYNDIIKKKKVTLYDGSKKFTFENADETTYAYTINGEIKSVEAIYLADANKNSITILKNAEYPLILSMNIGWTITLNSLVPSSNSPTDLSQFINNEISKSGVLWNKIDKSSQVSVEDLSDVGGAQSVYKEYHNHIEGLWVKTHNDTINSIVYYPAPLTHSDHTYYGGDIKVQQLVSNNFNRALGKIMVKTQFLKKSWYDTDIYKASPGNTIELYYNEPVKGKNGLEFGITGEKTPPAKQQLGFVTFQKEE